MCRCGKVCHFRKLVLRSIALRLSQVSRMHILIILRIQIEHANVTEAKEGDIIGIKVTQKVHPHDKVYKVIA